MGKACRGTGRRGSREARVGGLPASVSKRRDQGNAGFRPVTGCTADAVPEARGLEWGWPRSALYVTLKHLRPAALPGAGAGAAWPQESEWHTAVHRAI